MERLPEQRQRTASVSSATPAPKNPSPHPTLRYHNRESRRGKRSLRRGMRITGRRRRTRIRRSRRRMRIRRRRRRGAANMTPMKQAQIPCPPVHPHMQCTHRQTQRPAMRPLFEGRGGGSLRAGACIHTR
eukprot:jgi/Botrbrau1/11529/Bobra.0393s0008.1